MKKYLKRTGLIITILVMLLLLASCGNDVEKEIVTEETDEEIIISGLEDRNTIVQVGIIEQLEKVNADVVAVNASGEETDMSVAGGLLEELLQLHGKSQKDFSEMRFVAKDGYSVNIPSAILENRDIILAYEIDGKKLNEKDSPIRIIIPEERAMYWVSGLSEIEMFTNENREIDENFIEKLVILESAIPSLKIEDYGDDKVIRIEDLVENFAELDKDGKVSIKALDGLEKFEDNEVFRNAYIKLTGEEAPMFLGPEIKEGMTVKNILTFNIGETGFISIDSFLESSYKFNSDGIDGISVKDLFEESHLCESEEYTLTLRDGDEILIKQEDLYSGILYKVEGNNIGIQFSETNQDKNIEDLLSIEIK